MQNIHNKIVQVVTWSTWLATLLSVKDPNSSDSNSKDSTAGQFEQPVEEKIFGGRLIKATGELLMLPKDMIDMAKRRQVIYNLPICMKLCNYNFSRHSFCYFGNAIHVNLHHTC